MENRTTIQISEELRKQLRILASQRDVSYQKLLEDMIEVFKELDPTKTIVSLPEKLVDKIKTNLPNTDFSTASDYLSFIIRLMLYEEATVDEESTKKIKDRLKKLGYL